MANIKISNLPLYTGDTTGAYLVMNDSGNTETFKVLSENIVNDQETFKRLNNGILLTTATFTNQYQDLIWRTFDDRIGANTSNISIPAEHVYECYYQISNNTNITDMRVDIVSAAANSTLSIGLYSFGYYTHTDGKTYIYPDTLRYTFTNNLDTSTTGIKTLTGLNYTIDNSLTVDNMWAILFLPTNQISVRTWNQTNATVRRGDFAYYFSGPTSFPATGQMYSLGSSTLPTTKTMGTHLVGSLGHAFWLPVQYTINQ